MRIEKLERLLYKTLLAGKPIEGSADELELGYLVNLAELPNIKKIGEIGFNAGISSYAFLAAKPETTVISFDLGEYGHVQSAKNIIDNEFPKRHTLIIGNSTETVPAYYDTHPELKFDLIFIDGGHGYEVARSDIENMKKFATKDTILIVDDLTPWKPWGLGPTLAWMEALENGLVIQEELVRDGTLVKNIKPPAERIWVRGRYTKP